MKKTFTVTSIFRFMKRTPGKTFIRAWLVCGAILLMAAAQAQKTPVIIDADTGNEVDDLYALVRALIEPTWDIRALNATHWQTSHWAVAESMEESHRINQVILGYLDEVEVKTRRGGAARMYDWGDLAQHSAAASEIIAQAHSTQPGSRLTVVALGALTNVASAIYIDPSIESKIKVYWLGTTYDFEKGILRRNDFNVMMDQRAFDLMMHSKVELHIIPVNVAAAMKFDFAETQQQLGGLHPLMDYLIDRWYQHLDGSRYQRTIWDLAIIDAVIYPDWVKEVEIMTSADHGARKVYFYQAIEAEKMRTEFFEKMKAYFGS